MSILVKPKWWMRPSICPVCKSHDTSRCDEVLDEVEGKHVICDVYTYTYTCDECCAEWCVTFKPAEAAIVDTGIPKGER